MASHSLPSSTAHSAVVELNTESLFLKPVRLLQFTQGQHSVAADFLPFRVALSRKLFAYSLLQCVADANSLFNFPVGVCQLPDSCHAEIRKLMLESLHPKFTRSTVNNFHPFIVFPRLPFSMKDGGDKPDIRHRDLFAKSLRKAVDAIHAAGLVHMDLRPENVMWRCSCGDFSASCDFQLKVIDFEDFCCVGEFTSLNMYREDLRYPFALWLQGLRQRGAAVPSLVTAEISIDLWSVERIVGFIASAQPTFAEYMNSISSSCPVWAPSALS
jgi:serine/threonine protein kinase